MKKCSECNSVKEVWEYKNTNTFLCKKHYMRQHYLERSEREGLRRRKNNYVIKEDYVEIHFNTGDIGFIDLDDLEKFTRHFWSLNSQGYVQSRINGVLKRLHLYLLDFPKNIVDHKNRNKLDNRRSNLRECTQAQNTRNSPLKKNNTSGYPGVNFIKTSGKWRARITFNRKEIRLGNYDSFEEAVKARKEGEKKYFEEFSPDL
jgi:HNH endonuclease/AP2 domain